MKNVDWIIAYMANGVVCDCCGEAESGYHDYICNAHTHGLEKYNHLNFQMVIDAGPDMISYVLNSFGVRVQSGKRFKAGDIVEDIFEDCSVRLDKADDEGTPVLRVVIPDVRNRFPEDPKCDYPYSFQLTPTDQLKKTIIC